MKPADPNPALTSLLDDGLIDALGCAHAPDTADVALVDRVRHRVLSRIAEDSNTHHLTVQPSAGDWLPLLPGIKRKLLHTQGDTQSYLLHFAAGAVLPAHRHPKDEECVVIQGALRIGADLRVPAGGFHLAREGMVHAAITAETETVIFLRGAGPRSDHLV